MLSRFPRFAKQSKLLQVTGRAFFFLRAEPTEVKFLRSQVAHLEARLNDKDKQQEKLVEAKDKLVERLETQLDDLALQSAQVIAQRTAILCNRVIIDTGLRKAFNATQPFSHCYEQFLRRNVFSQDDSGQLSIAARSVLSEIPSEFQVKEVDLRKELTSFGHQLSKPFHYLQGKLESGLYVGGDEVVVAAVTLLVALLQQEQHVDGPINVAGKMCV